MYNHPIIPEQNIKAHTIFYKTEVIWPGKNRRIYFIAGEGEAVSYTHLDVYKRQLHDRVNLFYK